MKDFFLDLEKFKKAGGKVYPPDGCRFRAFKLVHFDKVKVVILGQDPYNGPNQANGLAFAVNVGQIRPPALRNIVRELSSNIGQELPVASSTLEGWAEQGVLLLNSVLTVSKGAPGSHCNKGWEEFTDFILRKITKNRKGIVFLLWGQYAQTKLKKLRSYHNLTLTTTHPAPFSAHKGFFGCGHFVKANEFLEKTNQSPIDWARIDNERYCQFVGHLLLNQRKEKK